MRQLKESDKWEVQKRRWTHDVPMDVKSDKMKLYMLATMVMSSSKWNYDELVSSCKMGNKYDFVAKGCTTRPTPL